MQARKYICYSEYGRKAKLQPIFFAAKIHMVLFYWFWVLVLFCCFLVGSDIEARFAKLQSICFHVVLSDYFRRICYGCAWVLCLAILRLQHLMDRSMTQVTFASRLRTGQSLYCTKAKLFIEKVVDMHFEFVRSLSK